MSLTKKQEYTISLINGLIVEFGKERWFTQGELPGVTSHSLYALVSRKMLEIKTIGRVDYFRVTDLIGK